MINYSIKIENITQNKNSCKKWKFWGKMQSKLRIEYTELMVNKTQVKRLVKYTTHK
jgi:hypothetical protein